MERKSKLSEVRGTSSKTAWFLALCWPFWVSRKAESQVKDQAMVGEKGEDGLAPPQRDEPLCNRELANPQEVKDRHRVRCPQPGLGQAHCCWLKRLLIIFILQCVDLPSCLGLWAQSDNNAIYQPCFIFLKEPSPCIHRLCQGRDGDRISYDPGGGVFAGTQETRGCFCPELCANCLICKSKDMEKALVQEEKILCTVGQPKSERQIHSIYFQ